MKFSIGADPELFLEDAAGSLVSAINKIGGSKAFPRPLKALGEGYAVQEDNVAVEFNIPPAHSQEEFRQAILKTKEYLLAEVSQMGLRFAKQSADYFPITELMTPEANVFGCDPDWNAWTRKRNVMPPDADPRLRSAGGHVHVGCDVNTLIGKFNLVKFMDLFMAVPSVLMDQGELRRLLYGKRGACRPKNYGVEYRTLSNFWIETPELIDWVYRNTERALEAFTTQDIDINEWDNQIREAVDNNNHEIALSLVDHFDLEVVHA